jgi:hypothetical protein
LAAHDEVQERRCQRKRAQPAKPQLVARQVNELWSWDITRLPGPQRGIFFYLYVMLDVLSRYVVGWMVAEAETAALASHFVATTCQQQGIGPQQLTIHSDRGSPMRAATMTQLLTTLGVAQSFARPRTPDDNPFSEAHFKTMKYRPDFPQQFATESATRQWGQRFFHWYNTEHYHVALGLMTPPPFMTVRWPPFAPSGSRYLMPPLPLIRALAQASLRRRCGSILRLPKTVLLRPLTCGRNNQVRWGCQGFPSKAPCMHTPLTLTSIWLGCRSDRDHLEPQTTSFGSNQLFQNA